MRYLTSEQFNTMLFYIVFTCPEDQINESLRRFYKIYSV